MPPKNAPKNADNCEKVNKELHPKTRKCVNKCNPGKSRNRDFRCVKTKSNTAKKNPSPAKKSATKKAKPTVNVIINCEQYNQVLNPNTLKCVDKCKADEERDSNFKCVKIVIPTPAVDDPNITTKETTGILNLINKYAVEGEKYQKEGIQYNNNVVLQYLLYLYLIEKYGSSCFVRGDNKNLSYTFGLRLEETLTPKEKLADKREIYKQIKLILNCIKRIQTTKEEIIIIPLRLVIKSSAHANMLIYRKSLGVIEHYEPHGAVFGGLDETNYINNKVPLILETIIKKMNTMNKDANYQYYKNNITYLGPNTVCPITGTGLQALENKLVIPSEVQKREGGGFCALWSIFWAEMVLSNPHVPTEDLQDYIMDSLDFFDLNKTYQEISLKTRNVIRGYLELLYVQVNNMVETIAPGRNMKDLLATGYKETETTYETLFDEIIGNLGKYISYNLFGNLNKSQQKNKFNQYLDAQFKKYNDLSYDEYAEKPASQSFSSLSL